MSAADARNPSDLQLDAFAIDLRDLMDRSVANLYSHLVTRPTGRAVRLAIESQLRELSLPAVSLVDLSSVSILDYSCADEVVAKLLLARRARIRPHREVYFVFQGLRPHHREPILEVLYRHGLAAVTRGGAPEEPAELLGVVSPEETASWERLEALGQVRGDRIHEIFPRDGLQEALDELVERGLAFRHPGRGDVHALSTLLQEKP